MLQMLQLRKITPDFFIASGTLHYSLFQHLFRMHLSTKNREDDQRLSNKVHKKGCVQRFPAELDTRLKKTLKEQMACLLMCMITPKENPQNTARYERRNVKHQ